MRGPTLALTLSLACSSGGTADLSAPPEDTALTGSSPSSPGPTSSTDPSTTPPWMDRGTWAWSDDGDPWGTATVVGDPSLEDAMLALMDDYAVGHVYGAYKRRPIDEPEVIAAWNAALHARGRTSHLLLSETVWPCAPDDIRPLITERFVAFNASRTDPSERFDGLHLDIEPHGLHGDRSECPIDWNNTDDATRLELMDGLAQVYEAARQEAGAEVPIHVDLPVWYDNVATGSFHWPDQASRDAWFARIDSVVDGVTLMAFCREDLNRIEEGVSWELGALSAVRIGLSAEHVVGAKGECETWTDAASLLTVAEEVEEAWGPGVDLQSWSRFAALVQD